MRNFLLAAIALISAGAKVAPLEPGVYAFFNSQTGQVLDVWGADKRENAVLSTSQWAQGNNQAFALQTDDNENFGIVPFHSLKGLTATDMTKDTDIVQRAYTSAAAQHWKIISKGNGLYALQNRVNGKFITAGAKAGDKVIQHNGNGQKNQLFKPLRVDKALHAPIKEGSAYTFISKSTSLPLEIAGADKRDGGKLISFDNLNLQNQQFTIVTSASTPEFVRLRAVHSGKVLSAARNGQVVQEDKRHGDRAQLWRFVETEEGTYSIENQAARTALTVGRKMEPIQHTKVDINNKNQQFLAWEI